MAMVALIAACGSGAEDVGEAPGDAAEDGTAAPATAQAAEEEPVDAQDVATDAAAEADAGDGELFPIRFQLNWIAGGYMAGAAVAANEGLYESVGLDVEIVEGNGSQTTAQILASGTETIGMTDVTPVVTLAAEGAPVKVLATINQIPAHAVVVLEESGIETVEDLRGKRVAVPSGSSHVALFPLLLEENGISPDEVTTVDLPMTSVVQALLQGEVDAISGAEGTQALQLEQLGHDTNSLYFADYGVSFVTTSIVANDSLLESNPEEVAAFVEATIEGFEIAMQDPQRAADAVEVIFPESDPDTTVAETEISLNIFCHESTTYFGLTEPERWDATFTALDEAGLAEADDVPEDLITYEFLPDESELPVCADLR